MLVEITGEHAPEAYVEAWQHIRLSRVREHSRNGPVLTIPTPTMLEIKNPLERLITDPVRDANPFFHMMEFIWVMAQESDVTFLEKFNKRYRQYAEDNGKVWGAYGPRWLEGDQLQNVVEGLRRDKNSRRAVLSMWNPELDSKGDKRDHPCNTHIYLRVSKGALDMLVCNRSNDMVWGMLGANVVVFTMLQELIASELGIPLGTYRVVTNNLHVYEEMPRYAELQATGFAVQHCIYPCEQMPLLAVGESMEEFMQDARWFVKGGFDSALSTRWFNQVAYPMRMAYENKDERNTWLKKVASEDWRLAGMAWAARRTSSLSTSTEP